MEQKLPAQKSDNQAKLEYLLRMFRQKEQQLPNGAGKSYEETFKETLTTFQQLAVEQAQELANKEEELKKKEEAIQLLQEKLEDHDSLQKQFAILKSQVINLQNSSDNGIGGRKKNEELQQLLDRETGEKEKWQKLAAEKQQHSLQLDRVIKFLREKTEEAQLESDQFKKDYAASQEALSKLQEELKPLRQQLAEKTDLFSQYETLKKELEETAIRLETGLDGQKQLEVQINSLSSEIAQKNQEGELLKEELQQSRHEALDLQKQLAKMKQSLEEKEMQLRTAQQHLAKKVKEASVLQEKLELQGKEAQETQLLLKSAKDKIAEIQKNHQEQSQQERQSQEKWQENLRTVEQKAEKWEEKYFQVLGKWQASDEKCKELEKIEEKYLHIQALLANLNTYLGAHVKMPLKEQELATTNIVPQACPKEEGTATHTPSAEPPQNRPYQQLFDLQKTSTQRPRAHLFDDR